MIDNLRRLVTSSDDLITSFNENNKFYLKTVCIEVN